MLLRRLQKASAANKDILPFDLFESSQTNPAVAVVPHRGRWCCWYWFAFIMYSPWHTRFFREKNKQPALGQEESVCVCARTGMNLIIFTRGRAAADFLRDYLQNKSIRALRTLSAFISLAGFAQQLSTSPFWYGKMGVNYFKGGRTECGADNSCEHLKLSKPTAL